MENVLYSKEWFYKQAETCPAAYQCIMAYEHGNMTWEVCLATMAASLIEVNKNKDKQIRKMMETWIRPF